MVLLRIVQLAHAVESAFCYMGVAMHSSQMTLGRTCCCYCC